MEKDYLTASEIWDRMCAKWPNGQQRDIQQIYSMVAQPGLRAGDHEPARPNGSGIRWQRNVQNVLKHKSDEGYLVWHGGGHYQMT